MSENNLIILDSVEKLEREFIAPQKFRFELPDHYPGKKFEITIQPLTEAQMSRARQFTAIAPPKTKVRRKLDGTEQTEEVDEDNMLDPQWVQQINEASLLRRAFVFAIGLPEIKFEKKPGNDDYKALAEEISTKFPEPYAVAIENEILSRSSKQASIINLANFSSSAG